MEKVVFYVWWMLRNIAETDNVYVRGFFDCSEWNKNFSKNEVKHEKVDLNLKKSKIYQKV